MTTVYTLGALGVPWQPSRGGWPGMLTALHGDIVRDRTVVPVWYNNTGIGDPIASGIKRIDAALAALPADELAILFGHSLGAAVIAAWLNQSAAKCVIEPERLSAVLIGNSVRRDTGYSQMYLGYDPLVSDDTRYPVMDIARQYDSWADSPNLRSSPNFRVARDNCKAGAGVNGIHVSYQNVDISEVGPVVWKPSGNVRYGLDPTSPLPLMDGYTGTETEDVLRGRVESAYDRIVKLDGDGN